MNGTEMLFGAWIAGLLGVLYIKMQFFPLSCHLCKGRWNIQCRE